jgi:DNA-binding response OmpR family regulator
MNTKRKILIACDDPVNLDFFSLTLPKLGYAVEKASNGNEALEKIRGNPPDLVLLETVLPGLSGWSILKALKADDNLSGVPVILLSDIIDVKDKVEAFDQGAEDYITKPFNFSEVLVRVSAALRSGAMAAQIKAAKTFYADVGRFLADLKANLKDEALCRRNIDELNRRLERLYERA